MSCPLSDHEVNRITSILHLATLLVTGTAMIQTGWFRIRGMQCVPHLGLAPFFGISEYGPQPVPPSMIDHNVRYNVEDALDNPATMTYVYTGDEDAACISPRLVKMMRIIIFLCFTIIIFSITGIFLNVSNFKNDHAKILQRNGIMSILTFITVNAIIGVCFYVTVIIEEDNNLGIKLREVAVSYEFGFYIIVASGILSILNAATSLLFGSGNDMTIVIRRPLIEDWEGVETFNIEPSPNMHRTIIANSASFSTPSRNRSSQRNSRSSIAPPAEVRNDLVMLPPPPPYTP